MARVTHYRPAGTRDTFPCKAFHAEKADYISGNGKRPLGTTDVRKVTCLDCLALINRFAIEQWEANVGV